MFEGSYQALPGSPHTCCGAGEGGGKAIHPATHLLFINNEGNYGSVTQERRANNCTELSNLLHKWFSLKRLHTIHGTAWETRTERSQIAEELSSPPRPILLTLHFSSGISTGAEAGLIPNQQMGKLGHKEAK